MTFLRDMDLHGVLADDMGLGKTLQTLAVLGNTPGPHLVVAPTSVLRNWEREAQRFLPGRKVCLYHGSQRKLDTSAWIVLTSYALIRLDADQIGKTTWSYAVLDEAQAIKNPDSQTARAALAIKADHRLCLTGTPVENRLEELWSLFKFLQPGLLGTASTFRERFAGPIESGDAPARQALRRRVRPYVLRRLKKEVATDLPPLTEIVERCTLSAEQRRVYDTVRQAMRREVMDLLAVQTGRQGASLQILEALLRMRQAACDPSLLPGRLASDAPSAKLDRLEELLVDLVTDGHKILVFSQWTGMLDRVEPRLRTLGIDHVRLDGSTTNRQGAIDKFQDPSGPPIFLLSLKAGGFGLNLTAADYVIHLDPWWNPAVEQQATDRAHRIGQDKPVVSIKLVAEETVEERILELQAAKKDLADAALGETGLIQALGADELRALFDAA
jgi:SNF2 family DNA or RNA helicase